MSRPTVRPLVVGHRGASGYRPEHTLASYQLAIDLGADFVEPDLVSTKDGVLVARHENEISGTTDVAARPEFADRRTTKMVDGVKLTGWFTEDFTLAELETLRAVERLPDVRQENTLYDGRYQIPTLQEVIDLARGASRREDRTIGIYPEIKHATYFHSIDQVVAGSGVTYEDLVTRPGLRRVSRYADGIGPDRNRVVPRKEDGSLAEPTTLVLDAHRAGLLVHPYTFRNENAFLPRDFRRGENPVAYGDAFAEYDLFYDLGVDGVFSDNPDTAVLARRYRLAARAG